MSVYRLTTEDRLVGEMGLVGMNDAVLVVNADLGVGTLRQLEAAIDRLLDDIDPPGGHHVAVVALIDEGEDEFVDEE